MSTQAAQFKKTKQKTQIKTPKIKHVFICIIMSKIHSFLPISRNIFFEQKHVLVNMSSQTYQFVRIP